MDPSAATEPAPLSPAPLPSIRGSGSPGPASRLGEVPVDLRGRHWSRLPTSRQVVALTFDAGSGAQATPSILDTLARKRVAATFFLTGRWVATYPELARRIANTPSFAIGNHTMTHPDLRGYSDSAIRAELDDTEHWLQSVTGKTSPRPIFRFPYGAFDARTLGLVNAHGYGSILWTADTLGWKGAAGGQTVESVCTRAVEAAQPGEIVLMHVGASPDGTMLDAEALPRVVDELRRRGYRFVTLREFLPG
ncbi:MAG: hypothetical protein NVSMB17_05930 [Candidatus Dormibacteria bacterium]